MLTSLGAFPPIPRALNWSRLAAVKGNAHGLHSASAWDEMKLLLLQRP